MATALKILSVGAGKLVEVETATCQIINSRYGSHITGDYTAIRKANRKPPH
jgi:hypothetical protein